MVTCFIIGLLFPVFSVCYLIAPKSPLGLFIRKPFIKFICHTASYLTFLFLLLLASQHIDRSDLNRQGPPPTIVEWMILPWVLGKCVTLENIIKTCYCHGILLLRKYSLTFGNLGMFRTGSDYCSSKNLTPKAKQLFYKLQWICLQKQFKKCNLKFSNYRF